MFPGVVNNIFNIGSNIIKITTIITIKIIRTLGETSSKLLPLSPSKSSISSVAALEYSEKGESELVSEVEFETV